jgi:hypothetical protein
MENLMSIWEAMLSYFQKIWSNITIVTYVFKNTGFLILMVILSCFAITIPDQAAAFYEIIAEDGLRFTLKIHTFWALIFALVIWSSVIWKGFKFNLQITSELEDHRNAEKVIVFLPKFFAMLPFIFVITLFLLEHFHLIQNSINNFFNVKNPKREIPPIVYNVIIEIALLTLVAGYIYKKYESFDNYNKEQYKKFIEKKEKHLPTIKQDYFRLLEYPGSRVHIRLSIIFSLILLLGFMTPINWGIHRFVTPAAIAILGLALITYITSIVMYFNDSRYRPFSIIIIGFILLFTFLNDNTTIRTLDTPLDKLRATTRPTIKEHFAEWLKLRYTSKYDTIPVVLIATEGGGIRAANWTLHNLYMLEKKIPNFNKYLYAISGVSGGGVGSTFYLAYKHDYQTTIDSSRYNKLQEEDYLSPVMSGLFFQATVKNFIPFKVDFLDRNKMLEDSWFTSYKEITEGKNTFDQGFLSLYYDANQKYNYTLPSLFINGTHSESGRKILTSNLAFENYPSRRSPFHDVLDTYQNVKRDIPLKTAASLCCRFPIVTSGGLISKPENSSNNDVNPAIRVNSGHVTDGGYFDNTGLETGLQIYNTLNRTVIKGDTIRFKIHVIFFQNSDFSAPKGSESKSFLHGISTISSSFLNAWSRGTVTREIMNNHLSRYLNPKVTYQNFRIPAINERKGTYPLGWYMTKRGCENLRNEATIKYSDKQFIFSRKLRLNVLLHEKRLDDTAKLMERSRFLSHYYSQIIILNEQIIKANPKKREELIYLFLLTMDLPLTTTDNEVLEKACQYLGKEECDKIRKERKLPN